MRKRSRLPLAETLAALLAEKRADHYGRWAVRPFLAEVADVHDTYKPGAIRAMVEGRAAANPEVLEIMADLLGVSPDHFLEYRVARVCEAAQTNPKTVDLLYDLVVNAEAARHDYLKK